jgi:hypothetical protein
MDDELQALRRRAAASPGDGALAAAIGRALRRAGQEVEPWVASAWPPLAPDDRLGLARALDLPLRALPWGGGSALIAVCGASAFPTVELDVPGASRALVIDDEHVLGAEGPPGRQRLRALDLAAGQGRGAERTISLPSGLEVHAIARAGRTVYVAGRHVAVDAGDRATGHEIAFVGALDDPGAGWTPLDVPPEVRRMGKSIDGLFVDGPRLVALDDIVLPKVLLTYDVTDPRAPRRTGHAPLGAHHTYERVLCGARGEGWLAVLSRGGGRAGTGSFIALHDDRDLGERCVLAAFFPGHDPAAPRPFWTDVAVVGGALVVARGGEGVAVLDLALAEPHRAGLPPSDPRFPISRAPELDLAALRPLPLALAEGEEALRLAVGADARSVVVAIGREGSGTWPPAVRVERLAVARLST